jgi:hypothetical protein
VETVIVKTEPIENCPIKEEPINSASSSNASDDEFYDDDEGFNTSDLKASNNNPSMRKVADLNFTCANCKNSYDDFETLTNHITSRVSVQITKI